MILKENKSFGSCFHQSKLKYNGKIGRDNQGIGQEIYVMRAPEPEDICWDRLSVTTLRKLVNRILNCFIIVVLLGGHFAFCTWIMTLSVTSQTNPCDSTRYRASSSQVWH